MNKPFNVNDIVVVTIKDKKSETTRRLWVRHIENFDHYWYITFVDAPGEPYSCGFCCYRIYKNQPKPYGVQRFEIVDHHKPISERPNKGWMVGHPGYDLMHNPNRFYGNW